MDNTKSPRGPYLSVYIDALLLEDINKELEGVMADMQSTLPAAGLVVRQYSKRGKKRDDYKYRNHVGKRAEQLRKVSNDTSS